MISKVGTCNVDINQAGTSNYAAAAQVVEAVTAAPAVSDSADGDLHGRTGHGSVLLHVHGGDDAEQRVTPTITTTTASVCTVSGNVVTVVSGTGTCTVKAAWPRPPSTARRVWNSPRLRRHWRRPRPSRARLENEPAEGDGELHSEQRSDSGDGSTLVTVTAGPGKPARERSASHLHADVRRAGDNDTDGELSGNNDNTGSTSASYPLTVN